MIEDICKNESLSQEAIERASAAAKGLYKWVNAIRTYFFVYRDSAPIRNKLIMADL